MRVRSTGLGKTEMVLEVENLIRKNGYLLLSLRSTEPVNWHVRIVIEPKDMARILKLALKYLVFLWPLSLFRRQAPPPDDY